MKLYRLLLPFLTILCLQSSAQSKADKEKTDHQKLKRGIDARQFHFLATSANTSRGKTIQFNGSYFLYVGGDSLVAGLPFFGQANQSAGHYGASKEDQGINFHTNKFTYKADSTKKGGWDITIIPENQPSASKISLSISSSGSCRTTVISSSRSNISFNGTVLSNFKD